VWKKVVFLSVNLGLKGIRPQQVVELRALALRLLHERPGVVSEAQEEHRAALATATSAQVVEVGGTGLAAPSAGSR